MALPLALLALCALAQGPVSLDLPAGLPESFTVAIPIPDGPDGAVTLRLERASNRASGFRLLEDRGGVLVDVEPPPVSTYRGAALEDPRVLAAANLDARGLTALVWMPDGERYEVAPAPRGAPGQHVVRLAPPTRLDDGTCSALATPEDEARSLGEGGSVDGGVRGGSRSGGAAAADAAGCLSIAEIAFDVDFEYYQLAGSSSAQATLDVEAALNAVNLTYARDVLIEHQVTTIVVQTAEPDPYTATDPGALLDEFRIHWSTTMGAVPRDTAHLVTGREMDGNIIGLAYIAVICNHDWGYGLSQFTFTPATHADVLGHELGHNWSAPHCLDAPGTSVMCGAGLAAIGPVTEQLILQYVPTLPCLTSGTGFATALPPHARDDRVELDGAGTIDVLANDYDGNCDAVGIVSHDFQSALGGSIAVSPGTGPGGRDELLYTPPPSTWGRVDGVDSFAYVVDDGNGGQDSALVRVTDHDPDLVGHYKLDELGGLVAADSSGQGHLGFYSSGVQLGVPGAAGGTATAAAFDAATDSVAIGGGFGAGDVLDRGVTVCAWIKPDAVAGDQRVFANATSWAFGLANASLRFTTHQLKDYTVNAGIQPGVWTHVAAVFDEQYDVSFYRNGALISTVAGAMPAGAAAAGWHVASLDGQSQPFGGAIDDVQVYAGALTPQQMRCVYESAEGVPGFAVAPQFVQLAPGGTQEMSLCSVGAGDGGALLFVLGTLSGTTPGFPFGGFQVPLNPDTYFNLTVNAPNQGPLYGSFGTLNPSGHATTRFTLPPGTNPALAFQTANHAWALIDPAALTVEWISAPQPVLLLP